ncbi:TerC family protein [Methylobacterium sp. WL120]|uniref:TerC family protein n=1 Tax=Methylobacterium sp. WL120 TaxID=2603887 RepID=UPI0011CBE3D2|nr:TerC family protein [Methylobacterium sp. WL120]TXM69603.1 TerC family protein [Methylobacterium sp. WL120]
MDATFFAALFGIIWVDLLLSGDNAIVIAMVSRQLPKEQQRKVIVFGTAAAVGLRIGLAFIATWLMSIYGLSIAAGLYLLYVAISLLTHGDDVTDEKKAATTFWGAVAMITLADVGMSLDNILAIAALAHGHMVLLALGVLISIPMVIAFSVGISAMIERFPVLKWFGAAVLGWAAGGIIAGDPLLKLMSGYNEHLGHILAGAVGVLIVLGTAWVTKTWGKAEEDDYYERYF